jgi:aspartyl-tRNA(Asn)/glutamyl-tRNA(Gln) amidotransferase subunit A
MRVDPQLARASIREIGKLFRQRKLSPLELTRAMLEHIARLNPKLNAYITVCEEQALKAAAKAESELSVTKNRKSHRDRGPLHGIPISLKDNIFTRGIRTTAGSKILGDFVPTEDAPVVASLHAAGAILLGKTNLHEFAYGVTSNNPHFGPVRNPWDLSRVPGGSSGGSAAALAAGLCYGSIGTDTGGSIRIPAGLCGVVGLKPGVGRVSAEGVVPLSATLDFVGPLARSVEDAALLYEAIVLRKTNAPHPRFRPTSVARAHKMRLGVFKNFFLDIVSEEVHASFEAALVLLGKSGSRLKNISLPLLDQTEDAGNQIAWAEATLFHQQSGWFPQRSADYGEDVRGRLEMGVKVSAVAYLQAMETRRKFIEDFHNTLREFDLDAVVFPTTPIAAPQIHQESVAIDGTRHPARALLLRNNRPANLGALPAISVPCGLTRAGLPVGLQFMTAATRESLLLEVANNFSQLSEAVSLPQTLLD